MSDILIKIKSQSKNELAYFLIKKNINYTYIKTVNGFYYIKTKKKNLKSIKKNYKKVIVVNYFGTKRIKKYLNKHYLMLIALLFGLAILYFLSNTIFSVIIYTDNKELKKVISKELDYYGIKKYGIIKSYKKINDIKDKIILNNADKIEWIEINRNGTHYEIMLTERIIIKKELKDNTPKHVVASKDALIKHISSSNGDVIKELNDYVKKGEVIISGNIYKYDKLIATIPAEGKVYGEVWYIVKTKVPFEYIEYIRTGEVINHYYIELFGNKMSVLGKYETTNSMNDSVVLIDKPYLFFKLIKEKKELYKYEKFKVSKEQAIEEAKIRSEKGILNKLNKGEYIIDKKVLNIYPYSSKIEIEIFYKVYENITEMQLIEGSE